MNLTADEREALVWARTYAQRPTTGHLTYAYTDDMIQLLERLHPWLGVLRRRVDAALVADLEAHDAARAGLPFDPMDIGQIGRAHV